MAEKKTPKALHIPTDLSDWLGVFCETNNTNFTQLTTSLLEGLRTNEDYFNAYLQNIDKELKLIKCNLVDIANINEHKIKPEHAELYEFVETVSDLLRTLPQWKEPILLKDVFYNPKKS